MKSPNYFRWGIFILAYFLTAYAGMIISAKSGGSIVIWVASGVALAGLLLMESKYRIFFLGTIFAACFLAHFIFTNSLLQSISFSLLNTTQAALGIWLIGIITKEKVTFTSIRQTMSLVIVAIFINGLIAFPAAEVSTYFQAISFKPAILDWWVSNALGLLIVTPLIITWLTNPNSLETVPPMRIVEGGLLILVLGSVTWLVFESHILIENEIILSYFVFPILVWSALRFSPRGSATTLFILSGLAIWFTAAGSGESFFDLSGILDNLLVVESVIIATSITTLLLATLVTELKTKQTTIEDGNRRFQDLTDNINDVFFAIDKDLRYTYWNKACEYLTGISSQEVLGKSLHELFPDIGGDLAETMYRSALENRGYVSFVSDYTARDKGLVIFQISVYPTINGLSIFAQDITEQKRANDLLRASEEKYAKSFRYAPNLITLSDLEDGRYLDVNEKFLEISGYEREEIIGRTSMETGWVSPENRKKLVDAIQRDGHITGLELSLRAKDGHEVICLYHGELIDIEGRTQVLSIAEDITVQRHAEQALQESDRRMRETLQNVQLIAVSLDVNGNITFCNDYLLNLIKWTREEIIGRNWFDICLPQSALSEVKAIFNEFISSGNIPITYENEMLTREGRKRLVRWSNTILKDTNGRVIGTSSIGEDITERNQIEAALRASETKFSKIFQFSPAMISLSSLNDGRYLDVNQKFLDTFGFTREEVINSTSVDHGVIQAEKREKLLHILLASGRIVNEEVSFRKKDGSEIICLYNGELIELNGETILLSLAQNISEQKFTEEQLRQSESRLIQAQNLAGMGTWEWDVATDKTTWSEQMFRIYGITEEEFTGRGEDYINFTHPDDRHIQRSNIKKDFEKAGRKAVSSGSLIDMDPDPK